MSTTWQITVHCLANNCPLYNFSYPVCRVYIQVVKEILNFLMAKKGIPEVLVLVIAVLLIALVITVFDKKIEKLNSDSIIPVKDSSNNINNTK